MLTVWDFDAYVKVERYVYLSYKGKRVIALIVMNWVDYVVCFMNGCSKTRSSSRRGTTHVL